MNYFNELSKILADEYKLLIELINITEKQQKALVAYEPDNVIKITDLQNDIVSALFDLEQMRFDLISVIVNIPSAEVKFLTMSEIAEYFPEKQRSVLLNFKEKTAELLGKLKNLNSNNRILATRARRSVSELMSILANSEKQVCNVKV